MPAIVFSAVSLKPFSPTYMFFPSLLTRVCTCMPLPALPTVIFGAKVTVMPYL